MQEHKWEHNWEVVGGEIREGQMRKCPESYGKEFGFFFLNTTEAIGGF